MPTSARRVIVVGAGVVGLTCAVRLLEAGHRVDVVARDLPLETTSAVAAALWYPYRALPEDKVTAWSATTYAALEELAADDTTGVRMLTGTEVLSVPQPDPWWRDAVPALDRETSLPPGYADGWTFVSPVLDMPVHLRWLAGRVDELGGTLTRMNLSALPNDGSLVVNATGLGARHFGADPSVTPVRGQVVVVEQVGLERWTLDGAGLTYIVPRAREIVVGGTDVEGEWSRTPDPAVAEQILHRATALVPEIEGARVLRHKVGLRPARPEVRLERVGEVIHCYGHGGAGSRWRGDAPTTWWDWRMTDVRRTARVVVARHGEALYESELLSDAGGWLSRLGRDQAADLGVRLAAEGITRVWTSDMSRAVQTGEIVAARLGVDVVVRTGVREFGVGDAAGTTGVPDPFADTFADWVSGDLRARIPGGESGEEVVARWSGVLEAVADEHEGESVLVVSHGGVMSMVLPLLATNLDPGHARDRPFPNCGFAVLERDTDGWVARSWLGELIDP